MKILFLVDGHVLELGGAELQAFTLAKTLRSQGHEVEVVAPHLDRSTPQRSTREGTVVRQLGYWRLPKLGNILFMLRFALFLVREGRNYDAIHIHMVHNMAAVVSLLRFLAPCPVVAKISGAFEFADGQANHSPPATSLKFWLYKCLHGLDYFQTISADTHQRLVAAGVPAEKIVGIPNGVNTEHFEPSKALHNTEVKADAKTVIAYCGRLVPVKQLHTLIDAAAILQKKFPSQFELRLHGTGCLEGTLEAQVARLGLEKSVRFCGRTEDVAKSLQQAHIYTQVSEYEGLSNAVLEAMSSGLPLVLSEVGGNKDVVNPGENGYLVSSGDATALAMALTPLIRDRDLCRQLGQQSRTLAEQKFSLKSVTARLLCLYNNSACGSEAGCARRAAAN